MELCCLLWTVDCIVSLAKWTEVAVKDLGDCKVKMGEELAKFTYETTAEFIWLQKYVYVI